MGPAVVIMVAGLVIAYQFIKPAPPRHIVLATGPEQGAYAYYGRLYRDRLQRETSTWEGPDETINRTSM